MEPLIDGGSLSSTVEHERKKHVKNVLSDISDAFKKASKAMESKRDDNVSTEPELIQTSQIPRFAQSRIDSILQVIKGRAEDLNNNDASSLVSIGDSARQNKPWQSSKQPVPRVMKSQFTVREKLKFELGLMRCMAIMKRLSFKAQHNAMYNWRLNKYIRKDARLPNTRFWPATQS